MMLVCGTQEIWDWAGWRRDREERREDVRSQKGGGKTYG